MIEGITILNQTEIMKTVDWHTPICISLYLGGILLMLLGITLIDKCKNKWKCTTLTIIGYISIFSTMVFAAINPLELTGHYRYECIIDDSVSITEVYDKYKVIEQRGDIWVLEDKE